MSSEEYAQIRSRLGVTSNGRPPQLSEDQEVQLHEIWKGTQNQPSRQRWLAVARAGIPLNSAWTTIQKQAAALDALGSKRSDTPTR
jgi:hypothetical protein